MGIESRIVFVWRVKNPSHLQKESPNMGIESFITSMHLSITVTLQKESPNMGIES